MSRNLGGVIGRSALPTSAQRSGIWDARQVYDLKRVGRWSSDPSFDSVVVLLHANGTNGSTTFTDSSSSPKTVTPNSNAQISTAQSKFGGASCLCDGTGDYLTIAGVPTIGASDFTIEGWFRFNALPSSVQTLWAHRSSLSFIGGALLTHISGSLRLYISNATATTWQISDGNPGLTVTTNTWHHIALVRSGATLYTFLDGTAGSTVTLSENIGAGGVFSLMAGSTEGGQEINGYFDEFRLTLAARYTASFTAPTEVFPE